MGSTTYTGNALARQKEALVSRLWMRNRGFYDKRPRHHQP
jgi:hypothetical protein